MKIKINLITLILSITVANIVHAKFDGRYYEKRMMDRYPSIMDGDTPIPIFEFKNEKPVSPQYREEHDLTKFVDYEENFSALAMKDGKIIFERYNKDLDSYPGFHLMGESMTKTLIGSVVGHTLCSGGIDSLDDTAGVYSKSLKNSIYKDISIKNLLRMASGINENRDNEKQYNHMLQNRNEDDSNSQIEIIQSIQDKHSGQGKKSRYHTLDVAATSILVSELTGKSAAQIFNDEIFTKMGASDSFYWWKDNNDITMGFAGAYMTTRDWAKFGQFINDNINNKTCLGDFYLSGIENSLSTNSRNYQDYGYYFWVQDISSSFFEKKPMIVLTGKWGQVMIVDHYNNSVVVLISASKNSKYGKKHIWKEVGPAMIKEIAN